MCKIIRSYQQGEKRSVFSAGLKQLEL